MKKSVIFSVLVLFFLLLGLNAAFAGETIKLKKENFRLKIGYLPEKDILGLQGENFESYQRIPLMVYFFDPPRASLFFSGFDDEAWFYTPYFACYQTGEEVITLKKREITQNFQPFRFTFGAELRLRGNFWLGFDYYQSGKMRLDIRENFEKVRFDKVQYVQYYPISQQYLFYLKMTRELFDRQTNYSIFTREFVGSLRYEFHLGRLSLTPILGFDCQQFNRERNEAYFVEFLYPWIDKIKSTSETGSEGKTIRYTYTVIAGLSAELEVMKHCRIGAEVWYRNLPEEKLDYRSLFDREMNWKIKASPIWRTTAFLKVALF